MSVLLIAETYRRQFSRPQQAILLAMCDEVRKGQSCCWPSAATVAWKSGYSERHVRRVWSQLESLGVLTRAGVSRLGTIRWKVDPTQAPAKLGRELRPEPAPDIIVSDPAEGETRTSAPLAPDISAPGPGHQVSDEPRNKPRTIEPDSREQRDRVDQLPNGESSLTVAELRAAERDAVGAVGLAQDALRSAERRGNPREIQRCQHAYDVASRRFLVIQTERREREGSGSVSVGWTPRTYPIRAT